jgi:hypothetical protein
VTELSWRWIVLMLTAPPVAGALVAYPFWRRREMIFGNLVGTTVILATAFALILRESIEIEQVTRQCLAAGYTCWPVPSAFTRYAIYAGLGMIRSVRALHVQPDRRNANPQPRILARMALMSCDG